MRRNVCERDAAEDGDSGGIMAISAEPERRLAGSHLYIPPPPLFGRGAFWVNGQANRPGGRGGPISRRGISCLEGNDTDLSARAQGSAGRWV